MLGIRIRFNLDLFFYRIRILQEAMGVRGWLPSKNREAPCQVQQAPSKNTVSTWKEYSKLPIKVQ
jgi:hypothetical protein